MKDGPDANKRRSSSGDASEPIGEHDTRPLHYESDRFERDSHPHTTRAGHITLPPPQSVVNEKYRIDVELGRGGMGVVYRAHHVDLFKPVALKWLLPEFASDPESRLRFGREARAVSNIKHDNVVDVYDFGIDSERGVPYLVMELLTGVSLSAYLEKRGRLDAREALDIMIQCMRGVAAAHKLGIVHRDLKPENIFLCEGDEAGSWRVKVLDFGVAAALEPRAEDSLKPIITRTTSRNIVGTVFYMPPEQLAGGSVDERADLYSMGVILYEILAGKPPYYGSTLNAVTTAIVDGNAAPLNSVVPGVDPALAALVHRAMAPRKSERFEDLTQMIQAFQQYRELAARNRVVPASALARVKSALGRGSTRAWAVATIIGVVLGSLIVWGAASLRTPQTDRMPNVAVPQLRPRHEEPKPEPIPEPTPAPEQSTSAATDPSPPAPLAPPSPLDAAAAAPDPKPAAEARGRKRRRIEPEPPAPATPKPQAPNPAPVESPAVKTPSKTPPPRIRYAEPW